MRFAKSLVLASGFLIVAASGSLAATCMAAGNGNGSAKSFTLTPTLTNDDADAFCSTGSGDEGKDSVDNVNALGIMGVDDWILSDKTDDAATGPIKITAVGPSSGVASSGNPGTWSLDVGQGHTFEKILVTLKDGNGFGAFLIDPDEALKGEWYTSKGSLSHASVFYFGKMAAVPLPAGGLLLLSGLGVMYLRGRRRRA